MEVVWVVVFHVLNATQLLYLLSLLSRISAFSTLQKWATMPYKLIELFTVDEADLRCLLENATIKIIQTYAPTSVSDDDKMEEFYQEKEHIRMRSMLESLEKYS